jgi:LuxR family transcriptional regulator
VLAEFRANLLLANTFDAAMDVLQEAVAALGFPAVVYSRMDVPRLPDGTWLAPPLSTRNYPHGWDRHWWSRFCTHAPYFHACFEGDLVVDWLDVQHDDRLTAVQRECCRYLEDHQLSRGLTVPIHLPRGQFAFVSAVVDLSDDERWKQLKAASADLLFLIAHHFHYHVAERFGSPFPPVGTVRLTKRERECLQWIAEGKTSADIGRILGRSEETVRLHVKSAMRKLGASSRAQAVFAALSAGAISCLPRVDTGNYRIPPN